MKWPQLPDYGCLPRWPHDGGNVFHPDDVSAASYCFRKQSVFRRDEFDGTYYHCIYGHRRFRMKPCLWLPVKSDGIDIGDQVETTGVGMIREIFVGTVHSMELALRNRRIMYQVRRGEMVHHALYAASELRLLDTKVELRPNSDFRLEPQSSDTDYRLRDES